MKKTITILLTIGLITTVIFCAKKKDDDNSLIIGLLFFLQSGSTKLYGGTSSPGDVYSLNLGSSTFTMSNSTIGMSASGTVTTLSTGFKKLVPTTYKANTATAAVSVTNYFAYALDVPGVGVLLSPLFQGTSSSYSTVSTNGSNRVSAFASVGDCSVAGTYNFVTAGFGTGQESRYGTVTLTGTTSPVAAITSGAEKYTKNGTSTGNSVNTSGTCSNGEITFSGTVKGFASSAGGFILDFGTNNGGVVALKQNAIALSTITSKTYAVIVSNSSATGDSTFPARLTCSGSSCTGSTYSNVETGTTSTSTVTITFGTPTNGLMTGTLTSPSAGSQPLAAIAMEYNGKVIIFMSNCTSASACSNVGDRSTAIMVSL